jgi:hypothetical protein
VCIFLSGLPPACTPLDNGSTLSQPTPIASSVSPLGFAGYILLTCGRASMEGDEAPLAGANLPPGSRALIPALCYRCGAVCAHCACYNHDGSLNDLEDCINIQDLYFYPANLASDPSYAGMPSRPGTSNGPPRGDRGRARRPRRTRGAPELALRPLSFNSVRLLRSLAITVWQAPYTRNEVFLLPDTDWRCSICAFR